MIAPCSLCGGTDWIESENRPCPADHIEVVVWSAPLFDDEPTIPEPVVANRAEIMHWCETHDSSVHWEQRCDWLTVIGGDDVCVLKPATVTTYEEVSDE